MGVMVNKSLLEFKIKIKSSKLGYLNDLRIPCYINDALEPIFLKIIGKVHGVSVEYFLANEPEYE